ARYDEALATVDEMQALGRSTLSAQHDMVINGEILRARVALARGDHAAADTLFAETVPRLSDNTAGIARMVWGEALIRQGRHAEAEEKLGAALATMAASGRIESPPGLLATVLLETARAHRDPAKTESALAALTRFQALGLTNNDDHLRATLAVAGLLAAKGRTQEANGLARHAAEQAASLLGPDHPLTREAALLATGR